MLAGTTRWAGFLLGSLFLLASGTTARAGVTLPGDVAIPKVDFERHVMGLLSRTGCNAGACHGSFQGKGGFRLSLFGADPAKDYASLVRSNQGRRVDLLD